MNIISISKREDLPQKKEWLIRALAVALSIVCAGLVIRILGYNPLQVIPSMVSGAVGTEIRLQQTILKAIPLVVTSLGILVAFKMKFWNIGGEGQIIMGALGAILCCFEHRRASQICNHDTDDDSSNDIRRFLGSYSCLL